MEGLTSLMSIMATIWLNSTSHLTKKGSLLVDLGYSSIITYVSLSGPLNLCLQAPRFKRPWYGFVSPFSTFCDKNSLGSQFVLIIRWKWNEVGSQEFMLFDLSQPVMVRYGWRGIGIKSNMKVYIWYVPSVAVMGIWNQIVDIIILPNTELTKVYPLRPQKVHHMASKTS